MIAIYLLDDSNYGREDAARDLVNIINDLDSVSSYITVESDVGTPSSTVELPVKVPEAAVAVERESYPLILTSKHIGEIMPQLDSSERIQYKPIWFPLMVLIPPRWNVATSQHCR